VFFAKLNKLLNTMYEVCDPIITKRDEFFVKTGFDKIEFADTRHSI